MAKELPYFKFEPNQWENGNIQCCSVEARSLFIDLCCMYWSRLGELKYALALQKLCRGNADVLQELCNNEIIEINEGLISIKFLDEQIEEIADTSEKRRNAANKRWSNASAMQVQSKSNAKRREEKRKEYTISQKHKDFCSAFFDALKSKGMIIKNQKPDSKSWIEPIRKLEEVDDIKWEDIKAGANYYFANIGKQYLPEIRSTKAFREKFEKLVSHKQRNK